MAAARRTNRAAGPDVSRETEVSSITGVSRETGAGPAPSGRGLARNTANRAAGPLNAPAGPAAGKYTIPADHPFNYFVLNGTGVRWAPGCFDSVVGNEGGACVPVSVTTRDQLRKL